MNTTHIGATLYDYKTGEVIRPATQAELAASIEAAKTDGGAGVIVMDGRSCYAVGNAEAAKVGHTLGPWHIDRSRHFKTIQVERMFHNGGYVVAELAGPDAEANAQLIAAAPELLRLLKGSLALLNRIPLVAVEANMGADICQARREIGAAIGKAEGTK